MVALSSSLSPDIRFQIGHGYKQMHDVSETYPISNILRHYFTSISNPKFSCERDAYERVPKDNQ